MTDPETWMRLLTSPFMLRSLIVALLVGFSAPIVGTYLVQRRLSLLGDGIGHVSLVGVAMGWLVGNLAEFSDRDMLALPGAAIAAVAGALILELLRRRGATSGDVAMALLFYGGIAGGVLIIGLAGGDTAHLNSYLFGSIASVDDSDVVMTVIMALVILLVGIGLRPALFAVCHDEAFARACGLPVGAITALLAVLSALTVAAAMRVVGVLLVSALMIVPVAIAQLLTSSFAATMRAAIAVSVMMCVLGLVFSYFYPVSSGATIVVGLIVMYAVVATLRPVLLRGSTAREVRGGQN